MEHMQLEVPSILALFETNKQERSQFIQRTVDAIMSGDASPLKIHLQIKAMEDIITGLTSLDEKKNPNIQNAKLYRRELLAAAESYGKKFELHNAKFSISEVGTKYDYSACNDQEVLDLNEQIDQLKLKLTERQKFLQNLPEEGMDHVNSDGELIKIYRPIKSSTTAVSVTLK